MFKEIEIEWLKSRRTKSYISSFLLMLVGVFWEINAKLSQISMRDVHSISSLFNDQTVETIVLPMIVVLFISGIVRNEHMGNTFKLQLSNGYTYLSIFLSKLVLSIIFFFLLSIIEVGILAVVGAIYGIQLDLTILIIKILGLILSYVCLLLLYLTLAMLIDKSGLLLGFGFLGSFLGIVLMKFSPFIWSFVFPWIGSSYLAPYRFVSVNSRGVYEFLPTQNLLLRFILYIIFIMLDCYIVTIVLKKKGGYND